MSFDDNLDEDEQVNVPVPPLKPVSVVANLIAKQSALDPRSPTLGIDRTPLACAEVREKATLIAPVEIKFEEPFEEEETKEEEEEKEESPAIVTETKEKETVNVAAGPAKGKQKTEVFVDVGRVIYGTPVQANSIQQVRTPLSCLANRKRVDLNGKTPVSANGPKKSQSQQPNREICQDLKSVKKSSANPFGSPATTAAVPRKLIR